MKQGGAWKLALAALSAVSPLSAGSANTDVPMFSSGTGQVLFGSDGSIIGVTDYLGPSAWLTSVAAGNGASFWIRVTVTSGTMGIGSDSTSTWLQMNVNRQFLKGPASNGSASCGFTVQFATDAAGSNIVCTSTGWIVSYSHS